MKKKTVLLIIGVAILVAILALTRLWHMGDGGLAGSDANHNGIRDDIEEFVKKYPKEGVRKAAIQLHQSLQQGMMDPDHWDDAQFDDADNCLDFQVPDAFESAKISEEIEAATANTPARLKAYWEANTKQSGKVFRASHPDPKACR